MKRINLALQGGGAHGAFTWGVLDRLLDEESSNLADLEEFIGKTISFRAEPSYSQEHFDIILL